MKKILLFSIVFSLLAVAATVLAASLIITTDSKRLPNAFVEEPYNTQIQVRNNGTPPYFFLLNEEKGDSFPPGINFSPASGESSNGTITIAGTPTKEGAGQPPRNLYIKVIDSANNTTSPNEKPFELRLLVKELEITNPSGGSLPPGVVGEPYPGFTFTATGGIPPYTWSNPETSDGRLLSDFGLKLSSNGKISGTPDKSNSRKIYIRVEGEPIGELTGVNTFFTSFNLTVNSAPFEFITAGFPTKRVNEYFSVTLAAHGGAPPYTWKEIPENSLPPGLILSGDIISGTPTKEGEFPFNLLLKDSKNEGLNQHFSITISGVCKENCGQAPGEPGPGGGSGTRSGPGQKERGLEIDWPPSPMGTSLNNDSDLVDLIKYLYEWAVALGGLAAFIALVIAGFQYLTSVGDAGKMSDALKRLKSTGLGLVLLFSSWLILNTINPQLVTLKMPSFEATPSEFIPEIEDPTRNIIPCEKVKIYGATNFKGSSDEIYTGECKALPDGIEINSIKIFGNCTVKLYSNTCKNKDLIHSVSFFATKEKPNTTDDEYFNLEKDITYEETVIRRVGVEEIKF